MENDISADNTKQFKSLTENEKKLLRKQRFNLLSENVNTLESMEAIEKEKIRNEERIKRFGTYKEEDKLKMRKERFGIVNETEKLKMRKERFHLLNENNEFIDKLKLRQERFADSLDCNDTKTKTDIKRNQNKLTNKPMKKRFKKIYKKKVNNFNQPKRFNRIGRRKNINMKKNNRFRINYTKNNKK